MNPATVILCALVGLVLAAKKKPVFGQMTLTGIKALDWLKSQACRERGGYSTGPIAEIWFCSPVWLMEQTYAVPDFVLEKAHVAVLFIRDTGRAVMVHQKSAMSEIESLCVAWEQAGWEAKAEEKGKKHRLSFPADVDISLNIRRKEGEFGAYEVVVEG